MSKLRKFITTAFAAVMLAGGIAVSTPASAFHWWGPGWGGGWGGWGGWGAGPAIAAGFGGLAAGAALGSAAYGYPYGYGGYGYAGYGCPTPVTYGCPVRRVVCPTYRRVRYCY